MPLGFWKDIASSKCNLSKLKELTFNDNKIAGQVETGLTLETFVNDYIDIPSITDKLTNIEQLKFGEFVIDTLINAAMDSTFAERFDDFFDEFGSQMRMCLSDFDFGFEFLCNLEGKKLSKLAISIKLDTIKKFTKTLIKNEKKVSMSDNDNDNDRLKCNFEMLESVLIVLLPDDIVQGSETKKEKLKQVMRMLSIKQNENESKYVCQAKKLGVHSYCDDINDGKQYQDPHLSMYDLYDSLNCVKYQNLNELEIIDTNLGKKQLSISESIDILRLINDDMDAKLFECIKFFPLCISMEPKILSLDELSSIISNYGGSGDNNNNNNNNKNNDKDICEPDTDESDCKLKEEPYMNGELNKTQVEAAFGRVADFDGPVDEKVFINALQDYVELNENELKDLFNLMNIDNSQILSLNEWSSFLMYNYQSKLLEKYRMSILCCLEVK